MAKLSLLVFLNSYEDTKSNNPSRSNFKWTRDINGIDANAPYSVGLSIPASGNKAIWTASTAKKLIYIESDQEITLTINSENITIKPIVVGSAVYPGIYMASGEFTDLSIANVSATDDANVYIAAIE